MTIQDATGSGRSPALPVRLDRSGRAGTVPLAAQLAANLRAAALDGRLREGDRLPSTRALAAGLGVSRTVTVAAYEELQAEGWLHARTGAGTFVAARPPAAVPRDLPGGGLPGTGPPARPLPARPLPARPLPGRPLPAAGPDGAAPRPLLDLSPGLPWVGGIDRTAWRRAWRRAAQRPPDARRRAAGDAGYRRAVADQLLAHRGLAVADPEGVEGVIATAGTSAAVAELAVAVLRPGDRVAVEEPGYIRAVACLRAVGVEVVPVPVDAHGLDPAAVPADVRAVYCCPGHQFPLGARMPVARRVQLVDRARRHGWLVVEDDYDGELRFDVAPPPVLATLARDVVVHLGSTSKILSPTLGCGWMVAPAAVVEQVLDHRWRTSVAPPLPGQYVLAELARTGDLGRHLRRVRRELAARREALVGLLAGQGLAVPGVDAGAHVVLRLPDAAAERHALAVAARAGLGLDPLSRHHHGPTAGHGVVVGYAGIERAQVRHIGTVVARAVTSATGAR